MAIYIIYNYFQALDKRHLDIKSICVKISTPLYKVIQTHLHSVPREIKLSIIIFAIPMNLVNELLATGTAGIMKRYAIYLYTLFVIT